MQGGAGFRTGSSGVGNVLPSGDPVAHIHPQDRIQAIGRHPIVLVTNENKLAIALQLIARIHHFSIRRSAHRVSETRGDPDAVNAGALSAASERSTSMSFVVLAFVPVFVLLPILMVWSCVGNLIRL